MKVKMESMYSDHVWELVELSTNVKSIGYKRGPDGSVETFKARLWPNDLFKQKELIMRKYFHRSPCLSLFEFSCLLQHISIIRFDKWTSRLHF